MLPEMGPMTPLVLRACSLFVYLQLIPIYDRFVALKKANVGIAMGIAGTVPRSMPSGAEVSGSRGQPGSNARETSSHKG